MSAPSNDSDLTRFKAASRYFNLRIADVAIGDDARIFERIAVERQDANHRGFEREENAGLYLRRP
jgi:hypothetical protein